jgi:hypothetical protein
MRGYLGRLANLVPGLRAPLDRRDREIARLRGELAARDKDLARAWAHAHELNDALQRLDGHFRSADYNGDSLLAFHRNVTFMRDERFLSAYRRGVRSGHKLGAAHGAGGELHIEWRVHVACWAAARARALPGALVECGVNTGILSLAACEYMDFNATGKDFFLFDTFEGIPEAQMSDAERADRVCENATLYEECFELVRRNFAPFPRATLVRGRVPDTLPTVAIDRVCYLSIDMNIVHPEVAALEYFWDKLVPGAAVILDDYGWKNYHLQQEAHDRFAASKGVPVLHLPTGQGLIIKP